MEKAHVSKVNRNRHSQKPSLRNTRPPINHNSCLQFSFYFLSRATSTFSFFFFLINVARRVSNAFLKKKKQPLSPRCKWKLSHFLGISVVQHSPKDMPLHREQGRQRERESRGQSVLAVAFGACHCPWAIFYCSPFVSRVLRGVGPSPPLQILFSICFFFLSLQGKPLIYAAPGRFWFSYDSWTDSRMEGVALNNCPKTVGGKSGSVIEISESGKYVLNHH